MRSSSLISILLVCASCAVRLPSPGSIGISVKTTTRVQAHVQVQAQVQGQVQAQVQAPVDVVVVPLQGANVVEFFGVPLEGAQDVVFVLDCSGSMENYAEGRLAQIQTTQTPPPGPPPGPPPSAPPDAYQAPQSPPPYPSQNPQTASPPPTASSNDAGSVPTGHRKIDVAQSELVDALARLPAGTRMNVLFFNSGVAGFSPTMVALDEPSRAGLIGFVQETEPTGSTALAPAMRLAFLMNARRVVLLSDGLGNVGGNAQSILRDAREAIRGGVRIDTIGLGSGQDASLLSTLARESGGLYQPL